MSCGGGTPVAVAGTRADILRHLLLKLLNYLMNEMGEIFDDQNNDEHARESWY